MAVNCFRGNSILDVRLAFWLHHWHEWQRILWFVLTCIELRILWSVWILLTCLSITGAIRGTSRDKLYQELGFESLRHRRWLRKLCTFYKILKSGQPDYLSRLIPKRHSNYCVRNPSLIPPFHIKHNFFRNSFFSSSIIEWNKLDPQLKNSVSLGILKRNILQFVRPFRNNAYDCHNPKGIKLPTRLRLGLSHLREHKFKHSFIFLCLALFLYIIFIEKIIISSFQSAVLPAEGVTVTFV